MHPLLVKLGPIPIHTYGFLIAIGFLIALFTIRTLSKKNGLNIERTLDITFWSLLVGFLGSRILFIITRLDYFASNPIAIFKVWEGGLVFLGGPIAVVPFIFWYVKKHKLPGWKTADVLIPGLVIAHVFGRLGCLSAGCCYGKPTESGFGIKLYSDFVDSNLHGIPLHPTQLYEASSLFILFLGLLWISKKKVFDGQVALSYFIAYPLIRSVIEIFRGDLIRGFVIDGILSTSQFISILVFLAASTFLVIRIKQVRLRGIS
ncbi:MAG: prolipoprotein diacylglyceryl transferase [Bdellovibrionales bacterium RIFOXYD1_FULL_44_7]|nr:MAG: prolipoprotein diacylglyceryl transferase [Bdellovibrionales bacterium RIFOXYD1_FULL_44_7]